NKLKFYGKELSESELCDSALTQTTYATTNNNDIIFELNDISESFQFSNHENLEIESIVNLVRVLVDKIMLKKYLMQP
ncbi:11966_t:CDS:1, partial [Racocetra fulgida]